MKVPPVAYRIGGTPDGLRDGETGFLVEMGDVDGLTKRLKQLLTDSDLRKRMGEKGREFAQQHFSLDSLASRHEDFYCDALSPDRALT